MLEKLLLEDVDELVEVEKAIFSHPWKKEDFVFELTQNPFAHYFCIKEDHKIIAYLGSWLRDDSVEITNVGVIPEKRRNGLGKKLMDECICLMKQNGAKVFTLEVRENNIPAINLYEQFGFKKVAVRKNYYQDTGENAYLMMMEVE